MYRLIGDNHALDGLPYSAQVFLRALDGVRERLAVTVGVPNVELRALSRVAEESRIDATVLVRELDLSVDAATGVVNALVDRGLLVELPADGEGPALELTPAGHALMERVYLDFQGSINTAADSLDEDRRFDFNSALLKMARKLDEKA